MIQRDRLIAMAALLALGACETGGGSASSPPTLSVAFADSAWNGTTVPDGQQCSLFGGSGSTPPIVVSGIPEGTSELIVEYNDESYQPLSYDGGHGVIGYAVSGTSATLPAVPGNTASVPSGTRVVSSA